MGRTNSKKRVYHKYNTRKGSIRTDVNTRDVDIILDVQNINNRYNVFKINMLLQKNSLDYLCKEILIAHAKSIPYAVIGRNRQYLEKRFNEIKASSQYQNINVVHNNRDLYKSLVADTNKLINNIEKFANNKHKKEKFVDSVVKMNYIRSSLHFDKSLLDRIEFLYKKTENFRYFVK